MQTKSKLISKEELKKEGKISDWEDSELPNLNKRKKIINEGPEICRFRGKNWKLLSLESKKAKQSRFDN